MLEINGTFPDYIQGIKKGNDFKENIIARIDN